MFIFTRSVRKLFVTGGVVISCGLFIAAAIGICAIHRAIGGFVFVLLAILIVAAVLMGNKLGYLVTRYIWRALAFLSILGGAINPFAWGDVPGGLGSLYYFIGVCLLISLSAFCLSYCLAEHAKLRGLEGVQKWRSFP